MKSLSCHLKEFKDIVMCIPFGLTSLAQSVKNLPAMQETWVRFLGQKMPWRRKWQSSPVFLPGKSHGQRSVVGSSPWGLKSQARLKD